MRAFRITFNTDVSKFTIEIQGFAGLYWKQAKVTEFKGEKQNEFRTPQNFDTYQLARDYVKRIGLDQIYEDFTVAKPYGSVSHNPYPLPAKYQAPVWSMPVNTDKAA